MTASTTGIRDWGPLAEPIHADAAGPGDPVWKDNAYLSFWDAANQVFGTVHVSTSPNGEGARRARCSVSVRGAVVEIIEDLGPGTFDGPSIRFGLDGTITVDHPRLTARLANAPLWTPADYADGGIIPELVPGKPLRHFQQACTIAGEIVLDGTRGAVAGHGMRDRTWGFRDESAQWIEYAGLVAVLGSTFVTAMKFLGSDGTVRSDGFLIDEDRSEPLTEIAFARNAAAQFRSARLGLTDGTTHLVTEVGRDAGFFVPMGADTEGPSFGTHDDFMRLRTGRSSGNGGGSGSGSGSDEGEGGGFFEQGILHRVF